MHTTLQLLREVQDMMENEPKRSPHNFEDRIIFMSMYNDIDWSKKDKQQCCEHGSSRAAAYAKSFLRGHGSFLGLGDEEK